MAFVTVSRLADLSPGKGICVEAGGKKLALFLSDGKGTRSQQRLQSLA